MYLPDDLLCRQIDDVHHPVIRGDIEVAVLLYDIGNETGGFDGSDRGECLCP
jgi:hypothetical protein